MEISSEISGEKPRSKCPLLRTYIGGEQTYDVVLPSPHSQRNVRVLHNLHLTGRKDLEFQKCCFKRGAASQYLPCFARQVV